MLVAELGNPTGGILLSLRRMSTVKIRARSLFRTPLSRIGAGEAGSGWEQWQSRPTRAGFPPPSTGSISASQVVHRQLWFRTCGKRGFGCKVK
jgi:hypothetical protein